MPNKVFSPEETALLLDVARRALSPAFYERIADDSDAAEPELIRLREKLQEEVPLEETQIMTREGEALLLTGDSNEYAFAPACRTVWVEADNIVVKIANRADQVGVELYPAGSDMGDGDILDECLTRK